MTASAPHSAAPSSADLASNLRQLQRLVAAILPAIDVRERAFRDRCLHINRDTRRERRWQERERLEIDRERRDAQLAVFALRREAYRQALECGMGGPEIERLFPRDGHVFLPSPGDFLLLLDRLVIEAEVRASRGGRQEAKGTTTVGQNAPPSARVARPNEGLDRVDRAILRIVRKGGTSQVVDIREDLPATERRSGKVIGQRLERMRGLGLVDHAGAGKGSAWWPIEDSEKYPELWPRSRTRRLQTSG